MFIFASSSSEKRAQIKARRDEHGVDDMNDAVAGNYVSGNNVRIVDGHTAIADDNVCNFPLAMSSEPDVMSDDSTPSPIIAW